MCTLTLKEIGGLPSKGTTDTQVHEHGYMETEIGRARGILDRCVHKHLCKHCESEGTRNLRQTGTEMQSRKKDKRREDENLRKQCVHECGHGSS